MSFYSYHVWSVNIALFALGKVVIEPKMVPLEDESSTFSNS